MNYYRASLWVFSSLLTLLVSSEASAAPGWLEVAEGGDNAVVVARGVTYTQANVTTYRGFLVVELEGASFGRDKIFMQDKSVLSLETAGGKLPKLYIELRKGAPTPLQLVSLVQVEQTAEGVQVTFPRVLPPAHPAPVALVQPGTIRPAGAQPATVVAPPVTPQPAASQPVTLTPEPALPVAAAPLSTAPAESTSYTSMIIFALFVIGGGLAVWMKRRQGVVPEEKKLRVIATHTLDGKNRLVLLSAGKKELLLSVSDQGTRLIEGWKKEDGLSRDTVAEPALREEDPDNVFRFESGRDPQHSTRRPEGEQHRQAARRESERTNGRPKPSNEYWRIEDVGEAGVGPRGPARANPEKTRPVEEPSAAVAGILRLRKGPQAAAAAAPKEAATDTQDENWARELLAFTNKGGAS